MFAQQIYDTFAFHPHLSHAGLDVQADLDQGKVVIRGSVRSYYEKQIAQEAVREIEGVRVVENELEVTE